MDPLRRPDPLPLGPWPPWPGVLQREPDALRRSFARGGVIRRGEPPRAHLMVVVDGLVGVFTSGPEGKQACLAIVGPGQLFGIDSLAAPAGEPLGEPRRIRLEARALSSCTVASIPAERLLSAIASDGDLARWMTMSLARNTVNLERRLGQTLSLPATARIVAVLEDLAAAAGRAVEGGVRIEAHVTQDDLAALTGATRETVNRAMTSLRRAGRVRRDGGRYVLPPPRAEVPQGW